MKKRKYLLTLALAGMLVFGNAPMTVSAASPNAGGTVVSGEQENAGDTLDIGENDLPMTQGEGTPETDIQENDTPLAVLSGDTQTSRFSWWGFWLGALTATVVETGVWAVLKSKNKKSE